MSKKFGFVVALLIAGGVIAFTLAPRSSAQLGKRNGTPTTTITRLDNLPARAPFGLGGWQVQVNNDAFIPGTTEKFNSYGQPAINTQGVVVFRGRSTGSNRQSGVYMRQFPKGPIKDVGDLEIQVPAPNNLDTFFGEFPSVPRIAMNAPNVATRANHKPVYRFLLPDGTESRAGTTGIYVQMGDSPLMTGASKLGAVPGFEYFAVPLPGRTVPFDVFPGSPAITDNGTIVFKGNYTDNGIGKTGVFFRSLGQTGAAGESPVEMIANSDTEIPNTPPSLVPLTFGSTAPPSVAGNNVVFVGLDNEDNPHYGGIYLAPIKSTPKLRPLVEIGKQVPGSNLPALTRVGEGLSFDGSRVAFWGAWGEETKTVRLYCATDGNADLLAYCNGVDPLSVFDPVTSSWYQEKKVPVNQGIFIYNINSEQLHLIATSNGDYSDFVFWGYSGKAPGTGSDEDAEPPRWRAANFLAVSDDLIVFKARTGVLNDQHVYVDVVDGLYLGSEVRPTFLQTLVETGMDGAMLDPMLQPGEMPIISVGIEREGLRGRNLAITASMANAEAGFGGVYVTAIQVSANEPGDFDGDGRADIAVFRPSTGDWHIDQSSAGAYSVNFGLAGDTLVPGDYDGDARTDVAVFRGGNWYLLQSSNGAFKAFAFGLTGDVPVPADYDGDAKTDIAVFRQGDWYIYGSSTNSFQASSWGLPSDLPMPRDYDGDGRADLCTFRGADGSWNILQSASHTYRGEQFGLNGDQPVAADYDGDGIADLAVFRPSGHLWYFLRSADGFGFANFGAVRDIPVPADYDGDGKADIAIFRPSSSGWHILQTSNGNVRTKEFGSNDDLPVPGAFNP